jgi:tetratricopeptide (TPR) repeat protein
VRKLPDGHLEIGGIIRSGMTPAAGLPAEAGRRFVGTFGNWAVEADAAQMEDRLRVSNDDRPASWRSHLTPVEFFRYYADVLVECVRMAHYLGEYATAAQICETLDVITIYHGRYQAGLQACKTGIASAEILGDASVLARMQWRCARNYLLSGDLDAAKTCIEIAWRVAGGVDNARLTASLLELQSDIANADGDRDKAVTLMTEAYLLDKKIGNHRGQGIKAFKLAKLLIGFPEDGKVPELLREARECFEQIDERVQDRERNLARVLLYDGQYLAVHGRLEEATALVDQAAEINERIGATAYKTQVEEIRASIDEQRNQLASARKRLRGLLTVFFRARHSDFVRYLIKIGRLLPDD